MSASFLSAKGSFDASIAIEVGEGDILVRDSAGGSEAGRGFKRFGVLGKTIWRLDHLKGFAGVLAVKGFVF
jgi:hypothetical protein